MDGELGDFTARVLKKARYVDESKCTACGDCAARCPVKRIPDDFEEGLTNRRAIYMYFSQGYPAVYTIDKDRCTWFLKGGKCGVCKKVCQADAIDFEQKDQEIELKVGAVILATGYDPYRPYELEQYGFGRIPDVVTAIQYERLITAGGPTAGHLLRRSNNEPVKSLAFLQCIGSRDETTNPYCCTYGCMHAIKEGMLAREHDPDCEVTIFYTDCRAVGKGFEAYRMRGEGQYGLNYVRGRVAEIQEEPETRRPVIWYEATEEGRVHKLTVDMAVLTTACVPAKGVEELAAKLDVELNPYRFVKTDPYTGIHTSRPGILAIGCCTAPMDIPESVAQASSAAAEAAALVGGGQAVAPREAAGG